MSIAFHSRITRQNRSKNEQATPKVSKTPLLGLDANGNKNRKIQIEHPTSFCYIAWKKRIIQIGPPEVCVQGRLESTH